MNILEQWIDKYNSAPRVALHRSKYVEGVCDIITDEQRHYAKVGLDMSPAKNIVFNVDIDKELKKFCEKEGWIKSICYGVLDVMLIGPMLPVNLFSCVITQIEMDPYNSTNLAFRLAARIAVQDLLSYSPVQRIYGWGYNNW